MPGTILFGIDVESASEASRGFARRASALFRELETPATWYVTGKTLDYCPDEFAALEAEVLIDLQAHTYSHLLLKTVLVEAPPGKVVHNTRGFFMKRGASLQEIADDLGRCQGAFKRVLGRRAIGLTGPWGYYRGLADRPDILEIVHAHGFHVLRTWARNATGGQPVPIERQPFFYSVQGFPGVLECPIQFYQDEFYWREFEKPAPDAQYMDVLKGGADAVAARDLVWGLCSHDHGCDTDEGWAAHETWFRGIIEYAAGLGIRFMTIGDFLREMLEKTLELTA